MLKIIGKAIGIALILVLNFLFWCYVEQTTDTAEWSKLARFLYMTGNFYTLYQTIINNNDEY
jgi:hypothetical protein